MNIHNKAQRQALADKRYAQKHPDKIRERWEKYRKSHPDKIKEWKAKYYLKHKKKVLKKSNKYYEEHRLQVLKQREKYRNGYGTLILTRKYGISVETYKKMLAEQDGKCAICKQPFTLTPFIDHCHKVGKVRGLLCRGCNTGLGNFQDSIENLEQAIRYLEKYKQVIVEVKPG